MLSSVLITGGAGFIGSRLCQALASRCTRVFVLDSLHPQVHGPEARAPVFPENVTFELGAIEDPATIAGAVAAANPQVVFHLAAETGTGQSYDEITRYCTVNVTGTALLVEALRRNARRLERIVLASSRAVYGEGAYRDRTGQFVVPPTRDVERMRARDFLPRAADGDPLVPVPALETLPPNPSSIYASTKLMQEHILAQGFTDTGVQPVILRFQNVYGPGQSLRNPYTGVLSIFCSQVLDGKVLNIYEDGEIVRDFVFVDDVVEALVRASDATHPGAAPINIGSGRPTTIMAAARTLLRLLGAPDNHVAISGEFRPGDVRYAVPDITRAAERLGWRPTTTLEVGLAMLAKWAKAERGRK